MPKQDEIEAAGTLAEAVRRAVQENRVELLRDAATDARAALVPWKILREWIDAGGAQTEPLRERLQGIAVRQKEALPESDQPAHGPPPPPDGKSAPDPENAASIALLQSWLEEDASDNLEEIARAQEELDEFKRGINTERERAGARRVYP